MKFTISGKRMDVTDTMRERIEKKLSKLDRYFQKDSESVVLLSVSRGRHTIEVTIHHNGMIFRAQETTDDMYTALDRVEESLERQLRKNKTRLEKRLREGAFTDLFDSPQDEDNFELIRTKRFTVKPMDVEEAILQMNLLAHEFFVFKSIADESICVVYRRKDGGYGLLEPH